MQSFGLSIAKINSVQEYPPPPTYPQKFVPLRYYKKTLGQISNVKATQVQKALNRCCIEHTQGIIVLTAC